jgi:hypothetical protein
MAIVRLCELVMKLTVCVGVHTEDNMVYFWGTLISGIYYSSLPAIVEPLSDQNIVTTCCGPSSIFAIAGMSQAHSNTCVIAAAAAAASE